MSDTIKNLLAVLDLSKEEQFYELHRRGLIDEEDYEAVISAATEEQRDWLIHRILADLAFRLRDEAIRKHTGQLWQAMILVMNQDATPQQVYDSFHEDGVITNQSWWILYANAIHWIIAALIAKELAGKDGGDG